MANKNQSVLTCILKVDVKCCCLGCQKKARSKLQSISGVTEVKYNSEKGLMTVTGDVDPMALVRKLAKPIKKIELVSVKYQVEDDDLIDSDEDDTSVDTSSNPDPKAQEKMKQKTGPLKKPSLLGCFSSKSKVVQPLSMQNRKWHVSSKFANATTTQRRPPDPVMPCPQTMQAEQPCMYDDYCKSQVPMTGAAMPYW